MEYSFIPNVVTEDHCGMTTFDLSPELQNSLVEWIEIPTDAKNTQTFRLSIDATDFMFTRNLESTTIRFWDIVEDYMKNKCKRCDGVSIWFDGYTRVYVTAPSECVGKLWKLRKPKNWSNNKPI